jgi:hypothetical protein
MLIESVLLEGFKDDQRYLIEKYPEHTGDLSALPPKWIAWLTARFGADARIEETHPFDDTIVTVLNFSRKEAAIPQKYRESEQFRNAFDERFPGKSPSDPTKMTVDELETILGLLERKKQRIKLGEAEDIEGDRVGKVGPWNLWMPTTREKSCRIAQYDPVTLEPKTTWCTARTAGSNLFYNYVGRPGYDTTLFYAIKDDPKLDVDWVSIGFINGKPFLTGKDGGLSVDRANKGLTHARLRDILGPYYDEIMAMLKEKNRSLGGRHPASDKVQLGARSVEDFNYVTKGVSKDEASDIMQLILQEPSINIEVLKLMFDTGNASVRSQIVFGSKLDLSDEMIDRVISDPDAGVRRSILYYFEKRREVVPDWVALKLWREPDTDTKRLIANHPSIPDESVNDFFNNLARSKDTNERHTAAERTRDPIILSKLARDRSTEVRSAVVWNKHTSLEDLIKLANDKKASVYTGAIMNDRLPVEMIVSFSSDPDPLKRRSVANNQSTPSEVLIKLSTDSFDQVRRWVTHHPKTPMEVLRSMLNDSDHRTAQLAREALEKRQRSMAESRLRRLIRQML